MKTQHNIQIPEYMSENNTKTLHQSQNKRTLTSRIITLLTMVTMLAWGNNAWAQVTYKNISEDLLLYTSSANLTASGMSSWVTNGINEYTYDVPTSDRQNAINPEDESNNDFSIGLNAIRLKNGDTQKVVFYVTGVSKVEAYIKINGSSDRKMSWSVTPENGETIVTDGTTTKSTSLKEVLDNLNPSVSYKIMLSADNELFLYAIRFVVGATGNVAPTVKTQPVGGTYTLSKGAYSITASFGGIPVPSIQWYSNTTESNEGGVELSGQTSSTLIVTPNAIGTYYYYAVATNSEGSVTTNVATVNVINESTDNTIKSVTANGNAVTANGSTYTKDFLNYGGTTIPVVITPNDVNATVRIGDINSQTANVVFGTTTIIVTAESGAEASYTLNLKNHNDIDVTSGNSYNVVENSDVYDGLKVIADDITMTYNAGGGWTKSQADSNAPEGYTHLITGGTNPTVSNYVPTKGVAFKFEPTKNGTLNIAIKCNSGKPLYVVEDGNSINYKVGNSDYTAGQAPNTTVYSILNFTVKANSTYYVYCTGSKLSYYGFNFAPSNTPTPDPIDVPEFSLVEEEAVISTKTPAEWGENKVQLPSIPAITASNATVVSGLVVDADNTATIQAALDAVPGAGGMVIIPEGMWLSGPLTVKAKTVLHLSANTTLKMLPYASYPVKKVDNGVNQYADFITASAGDVVIEGKSKETSIIEGQGADWWRVVEQDDNNNTTTFKRGSAIRFTNGSKYLVRNIRIQNTPGTNITLGQSERGSHFTIHDVVISNPASDAAENPSHNTDGIPVWGPYTNIYNCNISTGDDNVVFDSQSAYGHVWDCTFGKGHGASIGSFTVGVHDILWDNITFDGTESGFKIKSQRGRSGDVYNITAQNSTMTGVRDIIMLDCWYDKNEMAASPQEAPTNVAKETTTPAYHDITFKNITATDCFEKLSSLKEGYPVYIYGLPESPIKNVTFDNVNIEGRKGMFMAFANGINFVNNCNITNENSSTAHIATQYLAEWNGSYVTAAPSYPRTVKWNFRKTMPQALQGFSFTKNDAIKTHYLTADTQTDVMVVELPTSASDPKFITSRDDWAQFNTGTKVRVPVVSTSDEVSVTTNDTGACTVGGEKNETGKTVTHIATMEEVAAGYVEVEASKNDYLGLVQVNQKAPGVDLTPTWNETENRWEAKLGATPAENAESMLFAISFVKNNEVKTLYLPNGIYDLGAEHNKIVPDGMTIIGESRDGVIIKNRPTVEGISITATLQTGSNVTLKNLTLNCRAPYGTGSDSNSAERGICLQEGGSATSVNHYENIVLDGLQDTYYSNGANGMTSIFDNCIIRGTVDFICGNGNVTFNDCKLQPVMPHNGSKPTIAAPSTFTAETGFVFNRCTVEAATSAIDCTGTGHATSAVTDYYLARAWYAGGDTYKGTDRTPKAAFNSCTYTLSPNDAKWGGSIGYEQESERREFTISEVSPSNLTAVESSKTMNVDDEYTLALTTDYTTSSTGAITFESSNTEVATVSDAGVITAVAAGTATITINQAADETYAAGSCEIEVTVKAQSSGDGTEGTITWAVGNESAGTATTEIADAVSRTKVTVGSDLTATQVGAYTSIAGSVPMIKYVPGTSNAGTVAADMIEYTVTMKKGITFKPTSVEFDAVKEGTDGAYFSWSYTVGGVESTIAAYSDPKTQIRRNNNANPSAPLTHKETIAADASQTFTLRFYVSNTANDKAMSIGNIKINGIVSGTEEVRTFQDFKIDFRDNPYTVVSPAEGLPTGVVVDIKGYHDAQHGVKNHSTITVPVDGPVKFSIGGCRFSNGATVSTNGGTPITIDTKSPDCDGGVGSYNKFATYTYNVEEAATLVFDLGDYCPYFIAEACEFIPTVDVTYYDTNGTTVLGKETVEGSSALAYKYGESDVTVHEGSKFRGWFNTKFNTIESYTGKKVAAGTILNEDTKLYAVATPVEVATPGKTFTYDLTKDYFYQEDHEGITMTGKPYNSHGWIFGKDQTIVVPVAGNAIIKMGLCQFSGDANKVNVTSENNVGTLSPTEFDCKVATDGNIQEIRYEGPATTLTFTLPSGGYIHEVEVANDDIPQSDLAIVEGKSVIVLNPRGTYQLTKGEDNDFTTSSEATLTYTSDNEDMVAVSETGLLTAGTDFGQATITVTQEGNDKFQGGSIDFIVKVVSAHGQTAKPSATVGEDGTVYLLGNAQDPDANIYYTTDGSTPTKESTPCTTGEIRDLPANTIVKAIAIYDDKSPSDVITAYVKVPVTLTWDWNNTTTYSVKPRYSNDDMKALFDSNTQANPGSNFEYKGASADVNGKDYKFTKFQLGASLPKGDKNTALQFNVLTKAGLYFKPTATSATITRGGTNTVNNVDISIADETTEKYLGEALSPNRYDASGTNVGGTGYCTYSYDASNFTDMAMTSDLSLYIYTYNVAKDYYYADITIDGYVSGCLYDGEFFNVGYDVEPAESGYVVQKPSISSVMAGKTVVFNATPAEGYKFINWTKTIDGTPLSTDKTFIRTITEDTYVTANFQKIPLVTFSIENMTDIDGNVPAAQHVDAETYELNIPVNYVLYRDGSTMIGWTDGEKTYELGKSHHFDEDVTLKPKFQKNEIAITDANELVKVRWDFNHRERPENAPELNVYTNEEQNEKSTGIYTRTAMVNGVPVDIKMNISAPEAQTKLDNRDMTVPVSAAQVNPGTKVTIPAVPGMKVILKASTGKDERTISGRKPKRYTKFVADTTIPSFFGTDVPENHPTRVDDYTAEYIYNGDERTVTLTFMQLRSEDENVDQGDWGFYEWIEVEYPVLQEVKLFNSINDKLDREKNENAGTIEITAKEPEHANTGKRYLAGDVVTVSAEAKYGYTITGFTCNGESSKLSEQTIAEGAKSATVKYTVGEGENTVTAVYARQTTYAVRVITADLSLGEVTLDPIYDNFLVRGKDYIEGYYVQGTEVKLKSEAGEGNVLDYWMDGGETWKDGEDNPTKTNPNVDITVGNENTFYTAYFKPGEKGTVIFDMTGSDVYNVTDPELNVYSGSVSMNPATLSGVRSFNIPTNFTFFKPGHTLEHWQVKGTEATYELGQRGSFTSPDQTITLVPVFRQNNATQENRTNNPVIRYDFGSGIFNYDDPTSGTTRKVSAQKVNIPKNTKTFWTSRVWTEVLVEGNPDKNWRDVAMWVNTGTKGFIRNGDLPEWASFGPGTTFEVASCAGTKFSIMTYAPITTTTIDGVVPVLDEERSNPANHEYVYTHTTRSAEDRVKIVIGNDYSYYKWLESATLAANMVDLHIKTSDNVVGEVTSVKSWDEENYPSKDLDDGGKSFQKGNKVVFTFYRKFGAEFDKIIDPAKNNLPILQMLDNDKVSMVMLGDGTELETLDRNQDGTWGGGNEHVFKLTKTEVVDPGEEATQEEKDAYQNEKAKGYRTKYVVEFEITGHRDLEIQFKEKPTYYVTYNTGKEAVGVSPSAAWVEAGDYYTIGKNQTLYYEGHTLDHWVDLAGNVYNIGTAYQMSQTKPRDMLLYPVFRQNTFSLLDLTTDASATWQLGRGNGAPVISYQRINGIYIAQVSNGESEIDVKLDLIGESGKIDNKSYEERAQINGGSVFRFPVTTGCEISLNSSSPNNQIETTKICGKNVANGGYEKGQNVTSVYSGVAGEGNVEFADDGRYYTQFSITYKAQEQTAQPTLTSASYGETALTAEQLTTLTTNGSVTLTIDPDVVTNRVPAITAVVENGKADIEQATYQNPVATVTLKTDGGMSIKAYAVNFQFNVPATAPTLSSVKVRNATVTDGVANNAPVSGSIEITFDRIMKAANVTPASSGETLEAISAPQGKTLTFNYWHLPVDKEVTITIPANTLEDIYGKEYPEAISLTLHTAATNMAVEHKAFDYVVGYGEVSDINAIIQKVNANRGTERLRIFIPDGEYELTGNEISSWKANDETTDDNGVSMKIPVGGFKYNNHMTVISRANVSLIGQSQENTVLYNNPKYEGIGCTATIHVTGADDYLEELSLENRFPYYKANFAGRAVAFWDQGNRQVLKNVSLLSYQDTYYSHSSGNYRGYFEDCVLAGTVDWLCGNGDIWLERCGIMVRNRNGNNIAAPATTTQWGYVFNNCRVYPEEGADLVTDKSYTLARPWQGTPGATYLNTTFDVLPRDEGWQAMQESHVLKFHEYNSMDTYGHPISLGTRTLAGAAPLKGSDDLILTDEAASKYTIENVLGGGEAFDPRIYTQQIDAASGAEADKDANNTLTWNDGIELDDDHLQWNTEPMALCYFVFKLNEETGKWEYKTNIAQSTEDETMTGLNLEQYGNGYYYVRAANQRGGLGAPTKAILYTESKKYTLTIKQVGTKAGYGWSTICLPYNSKVPAVNIDGEEKDLKIYAANGENKFDKKDETIVDNYSLYLKSVDVINKEMGYVVYGPIGQYTFSSSSHESDEVTILKGNPTDDAIPVGNNNCYVLANKTTYGLGFYKYTGATLAAKRAWLPVDMVASGTQTGVNNQAKAITFIFVDDDDTATDIYGVREHNAHDGIIYDIHGRRITRSQMQKGNVYIIDGEKVLMK